MVFTLITLRWYHGGLIEFGPPPKYIGGHVIEFLDVDIDRMSYFELRDYIKELGYTIDCEFFIKWDELLVLVDNDKVIFDIFNMINDGDTVEVYVFHGVSEANQAPLELEFVPNVSDSGVGEESFNETSNPNNQPPTSTFPSNPKTGPSETSSTRFEDPPTIVPPLSPSSTVPPPSPSTVPPPSPSSTVPPPSPSPVTLPSCVPSSDPIIDNDPIDDEVEDESGFEGDTNEDTEVESDVHQEYIDIRESKRHFKRKSLVGTLGGDESYYLSDEAPNFEIDDKTGWVDGEEVDQDFYPRMTELPRLSLTASNSLNKRRLAFRVDSFPKLKNLLTFSRYHSLDIIRKELDIHVGRTIVRRARTRVLQEIMGDHIVEYGVCKGQLLVTVCRDGNNQMLPIAWAVVEVENQFTWTWFLELVRNDLDLGEGHQLSIITDMEKEVLPLVEHRKCARHVLAIVKDVKELKEEEYFGGLLNPHLKLS
ncbi:hypothetical protein KY284_010431 [Solanum tuberosum]|nr:hypothetical protein KY284_010431 [Solanum tuberosum]